MDHDVSLGMSTESRYNSNLRVLRRRDPSIAAIFDQFAHVALYNHDGSRWERSGYEGSMFVFERTAYPPYGIFILNRAGPTDYIQLIYPEDDVFSANKELSVIRSYPTFLDNRIAQLKAQYSPLPSDPFHPAYLAPAIAELDQKAKGPSSAVGLWVLQNPNRDSLIDVLKRLQQAIRENRPYPVEHRFGPGRPPPSHRLRVKRRDMDSDASDSQYASQSESETDASHHQHQQQQEPPAAAPVLASNPAIDALFKSALAHASPAPSTPAPAPVPTPQPQTGMQLLNSIFASAQSSPAPSSRPQSTSVQPYHSHQQHQVPTYSQPSTPAHVPQQQQYQPYHTHTQQPYSHSESQYPPPSTSPQQPRVLDKDVFSTLLGLTSSSAYSSAPRCASAASSVSGSARSHPSSREGDDEDTGYDTGSGVREWSDAEDAVIVDEDAEEQQQEQEAAKAGKKKTRQQKTKEKKAQQQQQKGNGTTLTVSSLLASASGPPGSKRVNGDVTPRPPPQSHHSLNSSTATVTPASSSRSHNPNANTNGRPGAIQAVSSVSTVRAGNQGHYRNSSTSSVSSTSTPPPSDQNQNAKQKPRSGRPLVPFEPDSELWPYGSSRGSDSERDASGVNGNGAGVGSGDEVVVELDFNDMSVLSDMDAFERLKRGGGAAPAQGQNQNQNQQKQPQSRRERGAARKKEKEAREREAIEKSWDTPMKAPQQQQNALPLPPAPPPGPPASPSPPPATSTLQPLNQGPLSPPQPQLTHGQPGQNLNHLLKTPTMGVRHVTLTAVGPPSTNVGVNGNGYGSANGHHGGHGGVSPSPSPAPSVTSVSSRVGGVNGVVDKQAVKEGLLSSVTGRVGAGGAEGKKVEKREFVMEVLKLIHSDSAFTESLYQDYLARTT